MHINIDQLPKYPLVNIWCLYLTAILVEAVKVLDEEMKRENYKLKLENDKLEAGNEELKKLINSMDARLSQFEGLGSVEE